MRALVAVLALAFVLAGCSSTNDNTTSGNGTTGAGGTSGGATGGATTTGPGHTGSGSTTTGPTSGGGGNNAPTGTVSASVPGGAVPLNVTFALSGADADGDKLSWTLDADGDGKTDDSHASPATFPATSHFTYGQAGLYKVLYAVSDGTATKEYNVTLNVTGGAPVQAVTGSWSYSSIDCPGASSQTAPDSAYFPAPLDGKDHVAFTVDAATVGKTFTATFDFMGGTGQGGVYFSDASGAFLFRGLTGSTTYPDPVTVSDTVPAGAAHGFFFSCVNEPDAVSVAYAAG